MSRIPMRREDQESVSLMPLARDDASETPPVPPTSGEVAAPLRVVVLEHADQCFLDTDGVTRDAARMLQILSGWHPNRSDRLAGVRRNGAFDPNLSVVVLNDTRICYPRATEHPGQPGLLFTIVPADAVERA